MIKFGDFELYSASDGLFKLDGGAMFGVVPKALWNKTNPANEMNRIQLGLHCLLIKSGAELILVDTGVGGGYDEKFLNIFEIDQSAGNLIQNLQNFGFEPEDITKVILTHLHFDHAGGNCTESASGEWIATFPNATYYFQSGELEYAKSPDPRSSASYMARNWRPLEKNGQLQLLHGDEEICPGVSVAVTGGHTEFHQIVKIKSQGKTACFLADLAPTNSHIKTPYVMGYDLFPKVTMEQKERVLKQALQENWLLLFEHAPFTKAAHLNEEEGKLKLKKVDF